MTTTTDLLPGLTAGTWNLDPSHTEASFTVRHAGISKVRGTVPVASGTIVVGDDLSASSVTASLDATKVSTGDANRDGHLLSGDFFDVENAPTWTFTSTAVRGTGASFVAVGDLTIHGVTQSVELEVTYNGSAVDPFGNTRVGFEASTTISRKEFGLTWNAALEAGGVLVADKVKIELDVSAIKG
jgi:polyisoprenoid-binding protein YceI